MNRLKTPNGLFDHPAPADNVRRRAPIRDQAAAPVAPHIHVRKWRPGSEEERYARLVMKLDEKVCNQARLARDARFDGRFSSA